MVDPIDPRSWPSPRGPWPEVTDLSRLFDHGQHWCVNSAGHPDPQRGYPDANVHRPWSECRTREWSVDGRRELDGDPLGLTVYGAAPFRFGESRGLPKPEPRVVVDAWGATSESTPAGCFSVSLGDARQLARILQQAGDELSISRRG